MSGARADTSRFAPFATCALAGFLCVLASPTAARPLPQDLAEKERALHLMPSSPWQLEFAENRCRLSRQFTSDRGPGLVLVEQLAPGQRFDLFIASPDLARGTNGAWLYFGMRSDQEMRETSPIEFDLDGYENAMAFESIRIDSPESGAGLTAVAISPDAADLVERIVLRRATVIASFETGPMAEPLAALNACTRDLLQTWGLDADAHQAYRPASMPNERMFFTRLHHDLASRLSNEGHESLLRINAVIENDGSVSDCTFEYVLSTKGYEPDVCTDITGMMFTPATGRDGRPIKSFYARSLHLSPYDPWTAGPHGGR